MTLSKQQDRILRGLCPRCGKEAAPYYYCSDHRFEGQIVSRLRRTDKAGATVSEKRQGKRYYRIGRAEAFDEMIWRDPKSPEKDRRFLPRLRRLPVDIETALIELLREADKPCTEQEIVFLWGALRRKSNKGELNQAVRAIYAAQERRKLRSQKRTQWAQSAGLIP